VLRTLPRRRTAALAAEAFVVTYPLVLMDLARQRLTTTAEAGVLGAPINQFAHTPEFIESPFAPVIAPNVDTLTSSAWLDLSGEPLCLSVPDTAGRYYAMHLYDAWTSIFATIGARTTGTREREFVLVGPGWRGRLPRHLPVVQSPTSTAWILGHIRSDGPADHPAVRRLQAGTRLTPLSQWGRPLASPPQRVEPRSVPASSPAARVARMDPLEYFGAVARLLADNPPHRTDRIRIQRMSALGVAPGRPPSWSLSDRPLLREIARGMAEGLAQVETTGAAVASSSSPWTVPQDLGRRRSDPLLRAAAAWTALGAWPRRDALFFTTRRDGDGLPLVGTEHYLLRFGPGAEPPAQAFWSLTAYDDATIVLEDSIGRPALSDRDGLRHGPDGALVVLLQPDPPVQARDQDEASWLQTPPGPFSLALRLYWPRPVALDGSWQPPPVQRRAGLSVPAQVAAAVDTPRVGPGVALGVANLGAAPEAVDPGRGGL
jgi:hypothetical protein